MTVVYITGMRIGEAVWRLLQTNIVQYGVTEPYYQLSHIPKQGPNLSEKDTLLTDTTIHAFIACLIFKSLIVITFYPH